MKDFDVVVIGAGLAGLQVSRLLAERRWRVLLVDRKSSLEQSIHTTGIFVRRTLEDFALPEDCLGPPVRHVRLYSPARRSMDLVSPHDEFRVGRMGLLYQKFLHNCRRAGVEWMPATRCVEHTNVKARSIVRLEQRTSSFSVRTRFIVGADGPDNLLFSALDIVIAQHKVPPMIAISIGNGSGDAQGSERGLEYDTVSSKYVEFVEQIPNAHRVQSGAAGALYQLPAVPSPHDPDADHPNAR